MSKGNSDKLYYVTWMDASRTGSFGAAMAYGKDNLEAKESVAHTLKKIYGMDIATYHLRASVVEMKRNRAFILAQDGLREVS